MLNVYLVKHTDSCRNPTFATGITVEIEIVPFATFLSMLLTVLMTNRTDQSNDLNDVFTVWPLISM